jgi:tetratricopeptide (TPR) repeat protein
MPSPTMKTIKRLFAVSGNQCAFPDCTTPLVVDDTVVAEICHIKARSPDGPRYDPDQDEKERHAFDNLLLLCPIHHKIIDADPATYTVEKLGQIKAEHEARHREGPEPGDDIARQFLVQIDVHAQNIGNLGEVLRDLGELEKARAAFERALAIEEVVYGPDHPNVARDVNNLGSVLRDLGQLEEARAAFERALAIFERVLGTEHPNVAEAANNLGEVLRVLGELAELDDERDAQVVDLESEDMKKLRQLAERREYWPTETRSIELKKKLKAAEEIS